MPTSDVLSNQTASVGNKDTLIGQWNSSGQCLAFKSEKSGPSHKSQRGNEAAFLANSMLLVTGVFSLAGLLFLKVNKNLK